MAPPGCAQPVVRLDGCRPELVIDPRQRSTDGSRLSPGVSSGRRPRQAHQMAAPASPLSDEEARLAALWTRSTDDTTSDAPTDGIGTLFSPDADAAASVPQRDQAFRADRDATRRRAAGVHGRRRNARAGGCRAPVRRLVPGAVVTLLLVAAALSESSRSTDATDPVSPPATGRAGAPSPPARSTYGEPKPAGAPAPRTRAGRERRSRPRTPRTRHQPARTRRDPRHVRPRAPHRTISMPPRTQHATPRPRTPARRDLPPVTPASSACDEFPPC